MNGFRLETIHRELNDITLVLLRSILIELFTCIL